MATAKSTTTKTTAKTKKTTNNKELEKQVAVLTEEVTALRAELSQLRNTAPARTNDFATKEQIRTALLAMGARQWMLTKAGLK